MFVCGSRRGDISCLFLVPDVVVTAVLGAACGVLTLALGLVAACWVRHKRQQAKASGYGSLLPSGQTQEAVQQQQLFPAIQR